MYVVKLLPGPHTFTHIIPDVPHFHHPSWRWLLPSVSVSFLSSLHTLLFSLRRASFALFRRSPRYFYVPVRSFHPHWVGASLDNIDHPERRMVIKADALGTCPLVCSYLDNHSPATWAPVCQEEWSAVDQRLQIYTAREKERSRWEIICTF